MGKAMPDMKEEIPEIALRNVLKKILKDKEALIESIMTDWKVECEKLKRDRGIITFQAKS